MPRNAYDISIREALQKNRKAGIVLAIVFLLAAGGIATYYFRPSRVKFNPTLAFCSDDDGQTYFEDSIYNFPPFEHNGKTAFRAAVATSGGHNFVAYLVRYTPDTRKRVQQVYDDAVRNNLPVQKTVLDYVNTLSVSGSGTEIKLPGSGNEWVPSTKITTLDIKSPTGETPEGYIQP